jgi:hypothetical protein
MAGWMDEWMGGWMNMHHVVDKYIYIWMHNRLLFILSLVVGAYRCHTGSRNESRRHSSAATQILIERGPSATTGL